MAWLDGPHPPLAGPLSEDRGLPVDPALEIRTQEASDDRSAGDDLGGKDTRRVRPLFGQPHLEPDVVEQRLPRIVIGRDIAEGRQPELQDVVDHGAVEVLLRAEVVQEVGLGQAGRDGDLVDGGSRATPLGEDDLRSIEDAP